LKAAATSSSLSGKRPYRFSAGTSYADYGEQNAKLQDMPHGRLPWLQGKSFAPLIT
jgi:hypothetical protein